MRITLDSRQKKTLMPQYIPVMGVCGRRGGGVEEEWELYSLRQLDSSLRLREGDNYRQSCILAPVGSWDTHYSEIFLRQPLLSQLQSDMYRPPVSLVAVRVHFRQ